KLDWFKECNYDDDQIEEIKDMVVKWWTENYKPNEDEEPYDAEPQVLFILFYSLNNIHKLKPDSIEVYLREPLVEENNVQDMGEYLKYW
ncbi:hypothetical protein BDQ17DRAFT_1199279, partial [Cyathus striatus]